MIQKEKYEINWFIFAIYTFEALNLLWIDRNKLNNLIDMFSSILYIGYFFSKHMENPHPVVSVDLKLNLFLKFSAKPRGTTLLKFWCRSLEFSPFFSFLIKEAISCFYTLEHIAYYCKNPFLVPLSLLTPIYSFNYTAFYTLWTEIKTNDNLKFLLESEVVSLCLSLQAQPTENL